MRIEFDSEKSKRNEESRGFPFDIAGDFEWDGARLLEDTRKPYPERRFQALGLIGGGLFMMVFTPIPSGIRIISLRHASRRERRWWLENQSRT